MTEADLAALGVHRIPIPIPFPQAGGPVNVYLVEEAGGGLLMFDAGLGSAEAQGALEDGLRRARAALRRGDADRRLARPRGPLRRGALRPGAARRRSSPVYAHPADALEDDRGRLALARPAPRRTCAYLAEARRAAGRCSPRSRREGERSFSLARRRPRGRGRSARATRIRTRHLDARGAPHAGPHARARLPVRPRAPALLLGRPPAREGLAEPAHRARPGRRGGLLPAARRVPREHRAACARSSSTSCSPATARRSRATARSSTGSSASTGSGRRGSARSSPRRPRPPWELSRALFPRAAGRDLPHPLRDGRQPRGDGGARRGGPHRRGRHLPLRLRTRQCSTCSASPAAWILARHARGDGDRPRHRQHRLPLDPRREAAAGAAARGAPARARRSRS